MMSYLGKQSLLFLAAALVGGGVALMIGRDAHSPRLNVANEALPKAKSTSTNVTGNAGATSSDLIPPKSTPQNALKRQGQSSSVSTPAQSAFASAPTELGDDETMLNLLRSLRSAPSGDTASSQEEKSRHSLKEALEKLLLHLRKSELSRSVVSKRDTEGFISTFVKIAPPSATEINTLKKMLVELQEGLPPEQVVRFQNESLQLLHQFVFDQNRALVVFLTEHFDRSPSKMGNFHSHLTQKPNEFWHHHNGEPIGRPPGESTFEGGIITNPVSPNFRFYHLATQR